MMYLKALVTAGALGSMALLGAGMTAGTAMQDGQPEEPMELFQGEIVDYYDYLSAPDEGDEAEPTNPAARGEFSGALALVVTEDTLLGDKTVAHVIVVDPDSPERRTLMERARRLIGKNVDITGHVLEREDSKGLAVVRIDERPGDSSSGG